VVAVSVASMCLKNPLPRSKHQLYSQP
jgi:hypothetical protein